MSYPEGTWHGGGDGGRIGSHPGGGSTYLPDPDAEIDSRSSVLGNAACVGEILQHLDSVGDLARCALVCRLWSGIAKEEPLWAHLRQKLFGDVNGCEKVGSARSWFITRSCIRSGILATRADDKALNQVGCVGENGDIAFDYATSQLVLMQGISSAAQGLGDWGTSPPARLVLLDVGDMSPKGEVLMDGKLPAGRVLLSCNGEGIVCATLLEGIAVCDLSKQTQLGILSAHTNEVISLKCKGSLLLSSCSKQVCIWSLPTLSLLSQHPIQLNLPFTRLDTYTRALSDISPALGLAAFCATNTLAANGRRGEVRHVLPLPIAHIVQACPQGQTVRRLQLTAVLGICFHNASLLVLSLLTSERHNSGSVMYGGTATVTIYDTATWEPTKLISPWLPGLAPLHCCFQVSFGFAAFVHRNEPRRWQVWGFDLGLMSGKGRAVSSAELSGGVMCVADSDRLPLMRLWQHEVGQLAAGSGLLEELQVLIVLCDQLLVKTKDGGVHRLGLRGMGCPGVLSRQAVNALEVNARGSLLRHGVWLV